MASLGQQVSLAKFTSWKVGGLAEILYQPEDLEDLQVFLRGLDSSVPTDLVRSRYQCASA